MFALSVRSLDGRCRRISAGPGTTFAEVRAELHQSIPDFHDVKLFQGGRELTDDTVVEVEVQAVVTKSEDKVFETVWEATRQLKEYAKACRMSPTQTITYNREALLAALAVLDEMGELAPARSKHLWESTVLLLGFDCFRTHFLRVLEGNLSSQVGKTIIVATEDICHIVAVLCRVCGDPFAFLDEYVFNNIRMHIYNEMILCLNGFLYLHEHNEHSSWRAYFFARGVKCCAQNLVTLGAKMRFDHHYLIPDVTDVKVRLQALQHATDVKVRLQALRHALDDGELPHHVSEMFLEVILDVTSVLQLICSQQEEDASVAAVALADSELDLAAPEPPGNVDEVGQTVDTEPAAETDQEPATESDPVLLHQQDLQEAIMRSKADGPAPICYDDSVVILRLTRCCEKALQALTESPVLEVARKRVEDAGCRLFPDRAHGALSLIPLTDEQLLELGLQLAKYHVLALGSDKLAIVEALREVPAGDRPKLRDDHRALAIPKDGSLPKDLARSTTSDIFDDIDLLHPYERAKIQQFIAANEGMSAPSVITMVTESAPCGDANPMQECKKSKTNPRHWK